MSVTQESSAIAVLTEMESVTYVIMNAGHMELNQLDRLVKSREVVDPTLTGWRPVIGEDNQVAYTVVFKSSTHSGQHKTILRELIESRLPNLITLST